MTSTRRSQPILETLLRHERLVLMIVILAISVLCWTWIVAMGLDMYGPMSGSSAWMMTARWDAPHLFLLWAMWAVMMAAMMLPSASPLLLLFLRAARARDTHRTVGSRVYAVVAGYLAVWALFSVGATLLQRGLSASLLLSPMMEPAAPAVGAAILLLAGVYQITPLKQRCLRVCQSPMSFLLRHWHPGRFGAFTVGVEHGLLCLGCCWALMLLLFAGGVMNVAVIVALTAWVTIEKLAPFGRASLFVSGGLMIATAGWILV